MIAAAPTSDSTALTVALIGLIAVISGAILTAVYMWLIGKRVGKPNGQGNAIEMLTAVLREVGQLRADVRITRDEGTLTRSMVEAQGNEFRDHQAEDRENFRHLFGARYEGEAMK